MAVEGNLERLTRAIAATMSGDTREVGRLFAPDVRGWSPAVAVSSREELAVELEDRAGAFSDLELDIVSVGTIGDRAGAEWVVSATHSGPLVLGGDHSAPATGRRVKVHGATVVTFAGERIRTFRHYWDEVELLDELGLIPAGIGLPRGPAGDAPEG